MKYYDYVKSRLDAIINGMNGSPNLFVKNPGKDFTRNRKLDFKQMVKITLAMGGSSLNNELLKYFGYSLDTATASAFVQQRDKILPFAFEHLMHEFANGFEGLRTYESYRLLALDGSALNIARNPDDTDTFYEYKPGSSGYNQMHLNAMYDLCNKIYVDALVQPRRAANERRALVEMVARSRIDENVIVVADRGYESFNVFAKLGDKGWGYVIRVKDVHSNGILSGLDLPDEDEFDVTINLFLTRKRTKEVLSKPDVYKVLARNRTFDFFDSGEMEFFPISFRVVRFRVNGGSFVSVITNLDSASFPPDKLKNVYNLRWGVETSFRKLKYTIGLNCFHAKKTDSITQEIFARITMYNFCELITMNTVVSHGDTKHVYQVNFTVAVSICKRFFKGSSDSRHMVVDLLILKYVLPVRPGRSVSRKIIPKSAVSFNYRVA
jgi:hypothetical protein